MDNVEIIVSPIVTEVDITVNTIGGGVTDHTLLTNIGTKTHATLDSEVTANNAKVTNATHTGEVVGFDGSDTLVISDNVVDEANLKLDEAPVNDYVLTADSAKSGGMKWAAASGGGGEFQIYEERNFIIDNGNVSNWVSANNVPSNIWQRIYNNGDGVAKTSSPTTLTTLNLATTDYIGIAGANQTIESLELFVGISNPDKIDKVGMVKARWINSDTFTLDYVTELLDVSATVSTEGYITIPSTSFTNTSISYQDIIYIFFGTTSLLDIYPVSFRLKCSID